MKTSVYLLSAAAIALSTTSALGGSFAIKEGSVSSQGMSFANYSAGAEDITHIYQNPAALQRVTGDHMTVGVTASGIFPEADGDFDATGALGGVGGDGSPSKDALVPGTYMGFRINPQLAVGMSITSPFGLRTEYDGGDPSVATNEATETDLKLIVATPMISGEIMNGVTAGAGFSIAYADLTFNSAGPASLEYRGDDLSFGFIIGMLADITETTTVGVAYRSGFKLDAEGRVGGDAISGAEFSGTNFEADAPGVASIGIKQELTETVDLSLEAQWQNWSVLDEAVISNANGLEITEAFGYEDAFYLAAGLEYEATDALKLRTGVAWDQTPTTDEDRSIRIPDEDRIWLSVGASYDLTETITIDAAYSYLKTLEDPKVDIETAGFETGSAEFDAQVHILSIGASMDF